MQRDGNIMETIGNMMNTEFINKKFNEIKNTILDHPEVIKREVAHILNGDYEILVDAPDMMVSDKISKEFISYVHFFLIKESFSLHNKEVIAVYKKFKSSDIWLANFSIECAIKDWLALNQPSR